MKLPPDSSESGQDYDYGSCDYPSCAGDGDISNYNYSDDYDSLPNLNGNSTNPNSTQITTTLGVIAGVGLGAVVLLIILYGIFKFSSTKYIEQDQKDLPKGVQPGKIKAEHKSTNNNNSKGNNASSNLSSNVNSKINSPRQSVANPSNSSIGKPNPKPVFQPANPPTTQV